MPSFVPKKKKKMFLGMCTASNFHTGAPVVKILYVVLREAPETIDNNETRYLMAKKGTNQRLCSKINNISKTTISHRTA